MGRRFVELLLVAAVIWMLPGIPAAVLSVLQVVATVLLAVYGAVWCNSRVEPARILLFLRVLCFAAGIGVALVFRGGQYSDFVSLAWLFCASSLAVLALAPSMPLNGRRILYPLLLVVGWYLLVGLCSASLLAPESGVPVGLVIGLSLGLLISTKSYVQWSSLGTSALVQLLARVRLQSGVSLWTRGNGVSSSLSESFQRHRMARLVYQLASPQVLPADRYQRLRGMSRSCPSVAAAWKLAFWAAVCHNDLGLAADIAKEADQRGFPELMEKLGEVQKPDEASEIWERWGRADRDFAEAQRALAKYDTNLVSA